MFKSKKMSLNLVVLASILCCGTMVAMNIFDAARTGNVARVQELIRTPGVDVNVTDKFGDTPLHDAASHGHKEIVELLLNAGANMNSKGFEDQTPLHLAALSGHTEVVELLIRAGADINMKNKYGRTALEMARDWKGEDVVALIIQEIQASRLRQAKQEVSTLATAAIERLGKDSPAQGLTSYLLQDILGYGAQDTTELTQQ